MFSSPLRPLLRPLMRALFDRPLSAVAAFSPLTLFAAGEQGAWYDPSDLTLGNMYQDSTKTLAVTSVEQPVGWIQDKSGRGNHAFQAVSTKRPVLSARVNLLTKTEDFSDGVWLPGSVTKNTNSITEISSNSEHNVYQSVGSAPPAKYAVTAIASAGTAQYLALQIATNNADASSGRYTVVVNLLTGDLESQSSGATTTGKSYYIAPIPGGKWLVQVSANHSSGLVYSVVGMSDSATPTFNTSSNPVYTGAGKSLNIWGADLRVANDGVNLPAYQRVNTATDYDTVGFPKGDKFDGIDDFQITSSGGGGSSAFFFCAAIRAGKVGATQTLFSDTGTNTGYRVRINASNQLEFSAGNGSSYTTVVTTATLAVGQRAVVTCWHDGTNLNAQINSGTVAQTAFATASAGTAQTTIGADNNAASSFFTGSVYESIYVKDDVLTAAQILSSQQYCATIGKITL